MLEIVVLGCGSSLGSPLLCCSCSVCTSDSVFDKRGRSSILIRNGENTNILVDAGYDIKNQLLREKISNLDALILTHHHVDHAWGIDDLRPFVFAQAKPLQIYTNLETADIIMDKFDHLFKNGRMKMNVIDTGQIFFIQGVPIETFEQIHGKVTSLGIKVKNFLYSCDVIKFSTKVEKYLYKPEHWIVDCIDYKSNPAHAGLAQVLEWYNKFKPKNMYLTGMSHKISYHQIIEKLPSNIKPLYDGYRFYLDLDLDLDFAE